MAPTSCDPLEQLLPGNDPAQSVPRASAVMVHSQVDVLSLWGHTPETLAACRLWELPKHHWKAVPKISPWLLPISHSPKHSPTNRKLHIETQKALSELRGTAEQSRGGGAPKHLCRSRDHRMANYKGSSGSTAHLAELNSMSVWALSTSPCSGGKYKYHWNAYALTKESRSGREKGCGRAYENSGFGPTLG